MAAAAVLLAAAPWILAPYPLILLCDALVLAVACLGLNLLLGTAGLLSLGQAAYFGLGAYAGGFLFTFLGFESLEVYVLAGVVTAAAAGAAFGALCVRTTRIHFAILTLALAQVVHALFVSGIVFRPAGGVGKGLFLLGGGGLYIPRFAILGEEVPPDRFVPALYGIVLGAFVAVVIVLWRVDRSPFGLALRALRDNEGRAASVGVPVRRYRWAAFVLAAAVTGLAGALFGQLHRQVTPEQLHWLFSARLVLATVLGGTRAFLGPVAGAFLFVAFQETAARATLYHGLVLGLLLVVVVRVMPGGVAGGAATLVAAVRRARGVRSCI